MVTAHDGDDRVREIDALQNFRADDRVDFHLFKFFRGQLAGFGNNVFRDRQFADIVQESGGVEGLHVAWR